MLCIFYNVINLLPYLLHRYAITLKYSINRKVITYFVILVKIVKSWF